MNKSKIKRIFLDIITFCVVFLCAIVSGLIVRSNYLNNKYSEFYSNEQIVELIQNEHEELENYEIQNIVTEYSEDKRAVEFTAEAVNSTETYVSKYYLNYGYVFEKGKWNLNNSMISNEMTEWIFADTIWSKEQDDIFYKIEFESEESAKLTLVRKKNDDENSDITNEEVIERETSVYASMTWDSVGNIYRAEAVIDDQEIIFVVAKKYVKLIVNGGKGEVVLEKE